MGLRRHKKGAPAGYRKGRKSYLQVRIITGANLNYPGIMNAMSSNNFSSGTGSFVYDPSRGLMVDHTDAVELELLSDQGSYALNIQLSATGRLKLCSDNSSTKVPGYDVCS